MASLQATMRARFGPWVKFLSVNSDVLLPLCRSSVSQEASQTRFHFISHQPKTFLHSVKRESQVSSHCKPYLCFQNRRQSNLPRHVPQVDLDCETKREGSDSKEVSVKSASEVLQNLGPEDARKLKIIKLEFDVVEQMYGKVPEVMTDENWLHALHMDSKSKRIKYYTFLRKVELTKKSRKRKQEARQQQRDETPSEPEELPPKNTIFFIIRDSTFKQAGNYRLAHAMQFGPPLVFDMDYEQHMRPQDCQNLVSQLLMSYGKNRESLDPFHFVFTSLDPQGRVLRMLRRAKLTGSHFLGTMTDKSYLELFPREKLVYLSPHASQSLKEVNDDDVYIVGGIVDKINTKPLSLAKAKEQRIRVAKFPLDEYLLWGQGTKSLALDQVTTIMLEQRRTNDWNEALKAIPVRKLYREDS